MQKGKVSNLDKTVYFPPRSSHILFQTMQGTPLLLTVGASHPFQTLDARETIPYN